MFQKILNFVKERKKLTAVILIALIIAGYFIFRPGTSTETRYVLASVAKETLVVSVSGTGQVSSLNQVDVKAKASGDILSMLVAEGQTIKSGTVLARINAIDAMKSVRDAQANLESAKLSLEKIKQPADKLTLLQAENNLTKAQISKSSAEDDLRKAYEDGFNAVSNAFLDLPELMTNTHDILFKNTTSSTSQWNIDFYTDAAGKYEEKAFKYRIDASQTYENAKTSYEKSFTDYKAANRSSSIDTIESLINETYETTKQVAESIKSANNLIQFYKDQLSQRLLQTVAIADTHIAALNADIGTANSRLTSLLAAKQAIQTGKESIASAERSILESTASLERTKAGTDELDIKSQELSIRQRQNALQDAYENLADYTVKAPFDGIVANIAVIKGQNVSSGTVVATMIAQQSIANISLNEVDVAKIKSAQKATLTFDAVEDLTITGTVGEVDTLGTVSQGVVTYNVKIVFDMQDTRIKPGMSVSAAIIIDTKADVLAIPSGAVKSQGDTYYVEFVDSTTVQAPATGVQGVTLSAPSQQQTVEIGISNDTSTEIVSGLKEGDQVVSRTITGSTTAPAASSLLGGNRNSSTGSAMRALR
ncbi:MAG: RND family efflux transporter MFP subunit, HlyD family secretion protein [Candidatus Peregrinibacteria bacterium GW2011_GWC2_39_14]|nr:MAG: Efflux transporter, RND family, MFP subunit [Candidatus Peregrinibacteria bacterium GW2011_GWA2_38_36]KKR04960.1 MAG: RND family efflux transporter MFP subunit, HlyD family secretion protein [Candidatus Peregrinibacteria bacterium GW2011_GWC2_39_14]